MQIVCSQRAAATVFACGVSWEWPFQNAKNGTLSNGHWRLLAKVSSAFAAIGGRVVCPEKTPLQPAAVTSTTASTDPTPEQIAEAVATFRVAAIGREFAKHEHAGPSPHGTPYAATTLDRVAWHMLRPGQWRRTRHKGAE